MLLDEREVAEAAAVMQALTQLLLDNNHQLQLLVVHGKDLVQTADRAETHLEAAEELQTEAHLELLADKENNLIQHHLQQHLYKLIMAVVEEVAKMVNLMEALLDKVEEQIMLQEILVVAEVVTELQEVQPTMVKAVTA